MSDPLNLKKTLRDRMNKEGEGENPTPPLLPTPIGGGTLSKNIPPTEAEKKAKEEALIKMLRNRKF
jgi:hypothetical protein